MTQACPPSLIIAAPSSGSGKTVITLALLRAFRRKGLAVGSFKVGPDYIDPAFHRRASGHPCYNIDGWAMRACTRTDLFETVHHDKGLVIGEGVMGLFDGAQGGGGATADISAEYNIPIVLVVDAKGQAASVAALLKGFNTYHDDICISGVIFNKVGGEGHIRLLKEAAAEIGIPALGFVPKSEALALDHRHLGLVQARENKALEVFLNAAADLIDAHVDLDALQAVAKARKFPDNRELSPILPLGQRIAVAEDDAFAFIYPHLLENWRSMGVEVSFFSPLRDEAPVADANAVYLPGGYPELYAETLSNAAHFKQAMIQAKKADTAIYGECGGFMTLGRSLIDADGNTHDMLGLLPVQTSFAKPKLHLGYRIARLQQKNILGDINIEFKAHEFHYAEVTSSDSVASLFDLKNARGEDLGAAGAVVGRVAGSFIHLIDRA